MVSTSNFALSRIAPGKFKFAGQKAQDVLDPPARVLNDVLELKIIIVVVYVYIYTPPKLLKTCQNLVFGMFGRMCEAIRYRN